MSTRRADQGEKERHTRARHAPSAMQPIASNLPQHHNLKHVRTSTSSTKPKKSMKQIDSNDEL